MKKNLSRRKRHWRIRKKVIGSQVKPRMSIYRSIRHLYVQLIDDFKGETLVSCSTLSRQFQSAVKEEKNNIQLAKELGKVIAQLAREKNIDKVVFDRSGYKYHGKILSLAQGAREGGLKF